MESADAAKAHVAAAEKALGTSWWNFKCRSDLLTASHEYAEAAVKFRAAGCLQESVDSWAKAGDLREKQADLFGAARAYETAGSICESNNLGEEAATENWHKAISYFRLCAKSELAAKILLKLAALQEKAGDNGAVIAAFQEAIDMYQDEEKKEYELTDIFRQYMGFLLRRQLLHEALAVIDSLVELLVKRKDFALAYKEILAKAVILLELKDTVGANEVLNNGHILEGWHTSKEADVGFQLVEAFQNNDSEAVRQVLKEQVFSFLQIEVARLAKKLHVPEASTKAQPNIEAAQPTPEDLAAALL